jgi:SAM-dependent methyltransferase
VSGSGKDSDPVFDAFADDYDAERRKNLGMLGRNLDAFARYKVQLTAELLSSRNCSPPEKILEFGCGIGTNLPFFRQQFPRAKLYGCDISATSLQKAREKLPDLIGFNSSSPKALAPFAATFDVVFLACVLHHIPPQERQMWTNALAATVKIGGRLIIFEHNPWNPATRYLVSTCPFDKGVVLVQPHACVTMLRQSGLQTDRVRYTLLVPWRQAAFVAIEKIFDRIPLGGQYCVLAQRRDHV